MGFATIIWQQEQSKIPNYLYFRESIISIIWMTNSAYNDIQSLL